MKTKSNSFFALILLIGLVTIVQSCVFDTNAIKGDGNISSVSRTLDSFDVINASGMFKLHLISGTEHSVTIETDENLHEYINVDVHENKLNITMKRNQHYNPTKMEVFVTAAEIKELNLSGASTVRSEYTLKTGDLKIDLSGASDVSLRVEVTNLNTGVSGAGSINISGNAERHDVRLSGASSLNCIDLITSETIINMSGAGSAEVFATEILRANMSGVGSIRFGGNPKTTNLSKAGIGSIKPI